MIRSRKLGAPPLSTPGRGAQGGDSGLALKVEGLSVDYGEVHAVTGVSFSVARGEALAIVGESGCGKSSLVKALGGLLPPSATVGASRLALASREGDLADLEPRSGLGDRLSYVFQEPKSHLNPSLRIGTQLTESLRRHLGLDRKQSRERALELLRDVGIHDPQSRFRDYPHQLSGGQGQRVAIAIAIAPEPAVLIADEPTSSLDVTVAARVVGLLRRLQRERGMALVHVTHNLHLAARSCDRVAVMYGGEIVESGDATTVLRQPSMPYTRALLAAAPTAGGDGGLVPIPGKPPEMHDIPPRCRFSERCSFAEAACEQPIPLDAIAPGHHVRCLLAQESRLPTRPTQ